MNVNLKSWEEIENEWIEWLKSDFRYELFLNPNECEKNFIKRTLWICYEIKSNIIKIYFPSVIEYIDNGVFQTAEGEIIILNEQYTKYENNSIINDHYNTVKSNLIDAFKKLNFNDIDDLIFNPHIWNNKFLTEKQIKEYNISKRDKKLKRIL